MFAEKVNSLTRNDIHQDEDVVDTWLSSWLWPISVFDPSVFGDPKNPGNADMRYYYPGNDLVTAPEILFFWVARRILAGLEFRGDILFRNVYLRGIVRDNRGLHTSKHLGTAPEQQAPIDKTG